MTGVQTCALPIFQISIDNQNIVEVKETNLLGVTLDENLTWKSEMSHVASKLRSQSV